MNTSLSGIFWKIWSKSFNILFWLFFISILLLSILLPLQIKPDVDEFAILWEPLITVLIIASLFSRLPVWIQVIYLFVYYNFGHQLIVAALSTGMINYNFALSSLGGVNTLLGFSVRGEFADFVFLSGLIIGVLFIISSLGRLLFTFMAKRKFTQNPKPENMPYQNLVNENKGISTPLPLDELKENVVYKPSFFKDRLWYQLIMFLLIASPLLIIFSVGGIEKALSSGGVLIVFGGSFLVIFLIFLPFFFWEVTTRIAFEGDQFTITTFFFKRTVVFYKSIKNIYIGVGGVMEISYLKQLKGKDKLKAARFFPWPFTTEKILRELKKRTVNINFDVDVITNKVNEARKPVNVIGTVVIVGIVFGFIYLIINQAQNRPKFDDQGCADQLQFWISDKPTVGILETRKGFSPELTQKGTFYFWIESEMKAFECNKKVSFTIINNSNKTVFSSEPLVPAPLEKVGYNGKIIYYMYENGSMLSNSGNYLMKINYGDIPTGEIEFIIK